MLNSYSGWIQYDKPQAILCTVWALNPSGGLRENYLWKYNFIYFFINCASLQGTTERAWQKLGESWQRFLCVCECKNVCELITMGRNKITLRNKYSSYVTFFFKCTQRPSNNSLSWHTITIHGSYQGKMLMKKKRQSSHHAVYTCIM